MDNVRNYLNTILNDNDTVIVACSSGPDSMCLLSIVQNLEKKLNIVCAHVNHKVRVESDEEYEYLEKYCCDNHLTFEGTILDRKIDSNFESEARKFRYDFLYRLKVKYNAKYILTAHHGDDEIETVLMRISRGSNLSGYAGIKMMDRDFVRPLLFLTKDEIIKYLTDKNIKYYLDRTNDEGDHTRNRYRHEILPFLKNENEDIHLKYLQFSAELQEYDKFINYYLTKNDFLKNNKINISKIKNEPVFIVRKAIEELIKVKQRDDFLEISNDTMKEILDLIYSEKSNSRISLSNGYLAIKSYDDFYIMKDVNPEYFNEVFDEYFENDFYVINKLSTSNEKSNSILRLDSSELKLPLIIRSRENADIMEVKNLGHKKVKDILINEKVELSLRDSIPLVLDSDGRILWIPGIKKSKFDKEKNEKCDIILSSERKQNFNE